MALTAEKLEQLLSDGKLLMNIFRFSINSEGHLMLEYSASSPPPLSINAEGHLIYTFPEG